MPCQASTDFPSGTPINFSQVPSLDLKLPSLDLNFNTIAMPRKSSNKTAPAETQAVAVATAPQPLTEFTLFPKLPLDIQVVIWEKLKDIAVVIDTSTAQKKPLTPYCGYSFFFSGIKPHPLSNTCKTSRWVLEKTKDRAWVKHHYHNPTDPSKYMRYLQFHPKSTFLFNSPTDITRFGMSPRHKSTEGIFFLGPATAPKSEKLLKANIRVVAIRELFRREYNTTARLHPEFCNSFVTYYHLAIFELFPRLERLILVKPAVCTLSIFQAPVFEWGASFVPTCCSQLAT